MSLIVYIQHFQNGRYVFTSETCTYQYTKAITKKWLNGDTIDATTHNVLQRNTKAHKSIVGIVDFMNRIRVGMTPRGVPLYNFHPYDVSYPVMQVASKLSPSDNQIALVSFEHWDLKTPRAGIQHMYGSVGDTQAEIAALRMGVNIPRSLMDQEETFVPCNRLHDSSLWDIVFNIDPEKCEDVDDVMGWRQTTHGLEFFIGIVDIAAWIPEGSVLDEEAKRAAQTLYIDGVAVEPMFPEIISAQKASLRADGVKRPVLALVYTKNTNSPSWRLLNVAVSNAYTYESVLQNTTIVNTLPQLLATITGQNPTDDPHSWVEQAMIAYNSEAGKLLKDKHVGLLRKHEGTTHETYQALAEQTCIKELAFLGSASGAYTNATDPNPYHAGLNLQAYCHASSPLRRYADVVNHRWIRHIVFGAQKPQTHTNPESLNHRATLIKHFERTSWFLNHIKQYGITIAKGIILTYDKDTEEGKVYVPAWKRTICAGKVTQQDHTPGTHVKIRAFTNIRATTLNKRIVCAMEPL
jgi:exoribonuclease R